MAPGMDSSVCGCSPCLGERTAKVTAKRNFQLDVVVHRTMHIQCNQVCFFSDCSRGETRMYQLCLLPTAAELNLVKFNLAKCIVRTQRCLGVMLSPIPASRSATSGWMIDTMKKSHHMKLQVTKFDGVTSAAT